eukprot:1158981-Pelagomonas_calceolata.AAC.10
MAGSRRVHRCACMHAGGGLRTPPSGPSSSEPNGPIDAGLAGLPAQALSQSGGGVRDVRGPNTSTGLPSRIPYLPPHHQRSLPTEGPVLAAAPPGGCAQLSLVSCLGRSVYGLAETMIRRRRGGLGKEESECIG